MIYTSLLSAELIEWGWSGSFGLVSNFQRGISRRLDMQKKTFKTEHATPVLRAIRAHKRATQNIHQWSLLHPKPTFPHVHLSLVKLFLIMNVKRFSLGNENGEEIK